MTSHHITHQIRDSYHVQCDAAISPDANPFQCCCLMQVANAKLCITLDTFCPTLSSFCYGGAVS
jgi:hypothetical protein